MSVETIRMNCPRCNQKIEASKEMAGHMINCSTCDHTFMAQDDGKDTPVNPSALVFLIVVLIFGFAGFSYLVDNEITKYLLVLGVFVTAVGLKVYVPQIFPGTLLWLGFIGLLIAALLNVMVWTIACGFIATLGAILLPRTSAKT